MREIKFRAWHPVLRRMLTAEYIDIFGKSDNSVIFDTSQDMDDNTRCSIMQYIGLKDKNGVEIYEGDIVRNREGYIGEVIYSEKATRFGVSGTKGHYITRKPVHKLRTLISCEVIGNIHENQGLLEAINE